MPALFGRKQIEDYMNASWNTIKQWIEGVGFPAVKLGGIWVSHTDVIDEWLESVVRRNMVVNTKNNQTHINQ